MRQQTEPVRSHTEDATLRQPNPYLMNRGHAVHPRDATAMSKAYPAKTKVVRIALTGGPCAGKSSALEHLIESATEEGFDILAAPEGVPSRARPPHTLRARRRIHRLLPHRRCAVATLYFNSSYQLPSALSPDFQEQLYMFQRNVLKLQLQMERCFSDLGGSTGRPTIVVFDRGLLDCRAFLSEENWQRGVRELNKELTNGRPEGSITAEYMHQRYDGVIHLVTAADGAEAHYKHGVVTDDSGRSVFRRETPAEAIDQDRKLEQAWADHPKQVVVRNGREGFEAKIKQATEAVLEIARAAHPKTCEEARVVKAKRMATKKSLLLQEAPQLAAATSSPQ